MIQMLVARRHGNNLSCSDGYQGLTANRHKQPSRSYPTPTFIPLGPIGQLWPPLRGGIYLEDVNTTRARKGCRRYHFWSAGMTLHKGIRR